MPGTNDGKINHQVERLFEIFIRLPLSQPNLRIVLKLTFEYLQRWIDELIKIGRLLRFCLRLRRFFFFHLAPDFHRAGPGKTDKSGADKISLAQTTRPVPRHSIIKKSNLIKSNLTTNHPRKQVFFTDPKLPGTGSRGPQLSILDSQEALCSIFPVWVVLWLW